MVSEGDRNGPAIETAELGPEVARILGKTVGSQPVIALAIKTAHRSNPRSFRSLPILCAESLSPIFQVRNDRLVAQTRLATSVDDD